MIDVFKASLAKYPDHIAFFLSNKEPITYRETRAIVEQWARFLLYTGVKQGDLVVVLTEEEDRYRLIHLALDLINATYTPRDAATPVEQLNHLHFANKILADEQIALAIENNRDKVVILNSPGIYPPKLPPEIAKRPLPVIIRDERIANYQMESSGTITRKSIPIRSAGIKIWAKIERKLLKLTPDDCILNTMGPYYDAGISEYMRSFAVGASLACMPKTTRRDLHEIINQCEWHAKHSKKITCIILIASQLSVPNQAEVIIRLKEAGLKHLMVTGDACTPALKALCEKHEILLWNCYGPTEATFGISIIPINGIHLIDENNQLLIPIGKPSSKFMKYYLINNCLYLESDLMLSPGYSNDPEGILNQKYFPIIRIGDRDVRVFNTGDRFHERDGYLIYEGRIDDSTHVKISGVKVELRTIEDCLAQYNQELKQEVIQYFAVIKPWYGHLKPIAYLVLLQELCKEHFIKFLKTRLTIPEMPIVIRLDELIRFEASGKIDRSKLISREDSAQELFFYNEDQPQITDEKLYQIQQIWKRILGFIPTSLDQEFMFAGGNSFQLLQLYHEIHRELCSDMSWQEFFQIPLITPRQLIEAIEHRNTQKQTQALINRLSTIQSDRINYFFLPALLGEGYRTYMQLANTFAVYHPGNLWGLTHPGRMDASLIPENMDIAVMHYIKAIQSIQSHGPYYIAGFSYGTTLAWCVAKKLLEMGEPVDSVHIIDGLPPTFYEQLPPKYFAAFLAELGNFVIDVLNTRSYGEQLSPVDSSAWKRESSEKQIDCMFASLKSQVQNPLSLSLISLAHCHMKQAREIKTPVKIATKAHLYLSNRGKIPLAFDYGRKKGKCPIETMLYGWDKFYNQVRYSRGRDGATTHLELLSATTLSQESRIRFWDQLTNGIEAHPLARLDFNPFYTLEYEDADQIRCTVFGLKHTELTNQYVPPLAISHQTSYPAFEYTITGEYNEGIECSTRYCQTFITSKEQTEYIRHFFSAQQIKEYQTIKPMHAHQSVTLFHESFYIYLSLTWNEHPIADLSFICRNKYFDLEYLLQITKELGLELTHKPMPAYSLIRFQKNFSSLTIDSSLHEASMNLFHQFTLLLEPYINRPAPLPSTTKVLPQLMPEIKTLKKIMPQKKQIQLAAKHFFNWFNRTQQKLSLRTSSLYTSYYDRLNAQDMLKSPNKALMNYIIAQDGSQCIKSYETLCQLADYLNKKGYPVSNPPCQFIDFAIALNETFSRENRPNEKPKAITLEVLLKIFSKAIKTRGPWQEPMLDLCSQLLLQSKIENILYELFDYYEQYCLETKPQKYQLTPKNRLNTRLMTSEHPYSPLPNKETDRETVVLKVGTFAEWEKIIKSTPIKHVNVYGDEEWIIDDRTGTSSICKINQRQQAHVLLKPISDNDPYTYIESPCDLSMAYIIKQFKLLLTSNTFVFIKSAFPDLLKNNLIEKKRLINELDELKHDVFFANQMETVIPKESLRNVTIYQDDGHDNLVKFYQHGNEEGIKSPGLFSSNNGIYSRIGGYLSSKDIAKHYADLLNAYDLMHVIPFVSATNKERLVPLALAPLLSAPEFSHVHINRENAYRQNLAGTLVKIKFSQIIHLSLCYKDGTTRQLPCVIPEIIGKYFSAYLDGESFNAPEIQEYIPSEIKKLRWHKHALPSRDRFFQAKDQSTHQQLNNITPAFEMS